VAPCQFRFGDLAATEVTTDGATSKALGVINHGLPLIR
jgi:hypothetical protein